MRTDRKIKVTHAPGASESVLDAIRTERELNSLIAGEGPADVRQIKAVVGRLHVVIADYLEGGAPLQIKLNPLEILSAIDAAIQEADGRPSSWPDGGEARAFFIHGLYDELVLQPSNIFETKTFPDGSERYIPISRAAWKACLAVLKEQIVKGGLRLARRGVSREQE
jgi:hypothetical protein